jgi:hypothetical protein
VFVQLTTTPQSQTRRMRIRHQLFRRDTLFERWTWAVLTLLPFDYGQAALWFEQERQPAQEARAPRYFVQDEVEEVTAYSNKRNPDYEYDTNVVGILKFRGGAIGKPLMTPPAPISASPSRRASARPEVRAVRQNAPQGFTKLFNGKDLSGWRGRQGDYSVYAEAKLTPEEKAAKQALWNTDRDLNWTVDAAKGELVSNGKGVFLATDKDYGDFEFYVDWRMVSANGDSGVYLRDFPQVQVWDPDNPREVRNGAPRGSGALWNDNPENPGKWPLVKADKPVGEWNTFKIKMVGTRAWVSLNDQVTVDGAVLDNIYDRAQPVLPRGAIELQTHGSEIRFRNIYVREIPAAEAKTTLAKFGG